MGFIFELKAFKMCKGFYKTIRMSRTAFAAARFASLFVLIDGGEVRREQVSPAGGRNLHLQRDKRRQ